MSKRAEIALALSVGLLVIAIRAPLMDLPLERDEGGYAYIAWRMTLGETPYLDWFDQKPPGIFAVYRVALSLSDNAVIAIRALAALCSAVASVALFYLVRALLGAAPRRRDLLIEHLHRIQDTYGHIAARHLAALAAEMRLSMAEVFRVATLGGAEAIGIANTTGTIEPGRRANLVIWSANPLDDPQNLWAGLTVIKDGVPLGMNFAQSASN